MSRGDRIRSERNRRKMSQMDLHKATDVGLRTIGRIEAGEAESSPSVAVLEAYLRIGDSYAAAWPGDQRPLERFSSVELLAELMRREG